MVLSLYHMPMCVVLHVLRLKTYPCGRKYVHLCSINVHLYSLVHRIQAQHMVQEGKDVEAKSAETKFGASNVYVPENAPVQYDYEAVAVPTGVSYMKPKPAPKPGPSSQKPSQSTEPRHYTRGVQKPKVNAVPKPIAQQNTPPEEIYDAVD